MPVTVSGKGKHFRSNRKFANYAFYILWVGLSAVQCTQLVVCHQSSLPEGQLCYTDENATIAKYFFIAAHVRYAATHCVIIQAAGSSRMRFFELQSKWFLSGNHQIVVAHRIRQLSAHARCSSPFLSVAKLNFLAAESFASPLRLVSTLWTPQSKAKFFNIKFFSANTESVAGSLIEEWTWSVSKYVIFMPA